MTRTGKADAGADVAAWAAERGWAVVEIIPGKKRPTHKWADLGWRDPDTLRAIWAKRSYSVGILTEPSGLVCDDLDVDDEGNPAGDWDLEELAASAGRSVPRTFTLATPSGGTQLIWQSNNGREFKTCAGQVAPHFDVRGRGGLFVLWEPGNDLRFVTDDRDPVIMPKWLAELHPEPGSATGTIADIPNVREWLNEYGDDGDAPCDGMSNTCYKWLEEFDYGVPHDVMARAQLALVGDRVAGCTGLNSALRSVMDAFARAAHGRKRGGEWRTDWRNSLAGAIGKKVGVMGEPRDEDPCTELDDMFTAVALGGTYVDDIVDANAEWLCKPFFPFGSLVILDGDPGQGKSVITNLIASNASAGREILPVGESCKMPIRCGLVISEDDDSIVRGRLRAAGYVFDRSIMMMNTKRHGKYLKFPDGVVWVKKFIQKNQLLLLIIDPISQYIAEKIQTHNESSVRDALGPLADVAKETGCCILLVRHLNKAGQMKAMYRGGGSIAFSALARSGLITGITPDGRYGIAQVKCSYARRFGGTLAYSVEEWEDDEEIPVIAWYGEVDIDADELAKGPQARKGPEPTSQNIIRDVLEQLFETKDTWPQKEVLKNLEDAGASTEHKIVDKVRAQLGIVARPVKRKDKKYAGWEWTIQPTKATISGEKD